MEVRFGIEPTCKVLKKLFCFNNLALFSGVVQSIARKRAEFMQDNLMPAMGGQRIPPGTAAEIVLFPFQAFQ